MSYEVLLLGLLVGAANYCFRYLPLRLRVGNARPTKRGAVSILYDTMSMAWMCALLVVSTAPEVMHDHAVSCPRWSASRYWVSVSINCSIAGRCLDLALYNYCRSDRDLLVFGTASFRRNR